MKRLLPTILLTFCVTAVYAELPENPVEVGQVHWMRGLDDALRK